MKRKIVILAAALLLCGCGNTSGKVTDSKPVENTSQTEQTSSHTAAEIFDMLSSSGKADVLDERADFGSDDFTSACPKLYGVAADSLTDGGIMFVSSGQQSDEVSILKGADISVLKDRAETRAKDFEGYAPEESEKAKNAEIFRCGDFAVMIISDNASELKKLITEY